MNRYYQFLSKSRFVILLALLVTFSFVGQSTVSAQSTLPFNDGVLTGITGMGNPTTLQFGPDDRLYVAERHGTIYALTIERLAPANYNVINQENIDLIWQDIPNRTDTGEIDTSSGFIMTSRQITGLLVTGTATNPVLYVSSSDPREGGGVSGAETDLDTNSGVVSRLTWNGSSWDHLQLVRGLPRSEENHAVNGMALDESTNTLYLTVGGFTNMGAPSFNFTYITEYAYAAAILSIDLDAIGNTTYDLPTLDDPTRANLPDGSDPNDPFGGNDGLNQARIDPAGPVQVYASGFRNPYDVVITEAGRMYTIDNGPNYDWGGPPVNQNPGQCDQTINEADSYTYYDNLHFISGEGYYGGHPAPVRANPEGIYGVGNEANSPVPYAEANPVECDFRIPGVEDGALATWVTSTNGIVEYTSSSLGGVAQGDLFTASYDGNIYRMKLNAAGDGLVDLSPGTTGDWGYVAEMSGNMIVPLDVTAQGDSDIFPGTVWVAVFVNKEIAVFEPNDFPCDGFYDAGIDEDGDGFTNADEIDNGMNPCSSASSPPDNDGDFISDLNDPDDDNDGIPDLTDFFQIDPQNGVQTTLPVHYDFFQDDPGTGFFGVGFTGLMVNGTTDYLDMFEIAELTVGGTAGKATVDNLTEGTAYGATNTQDYAYQWGVNVTSATGTFGINSQLNNPGFSPAPEPGDEQGIYFGTGDQDNYFELAIAADDSTGDIGFEVIVEVAGVPTRTFYPVPGATSSTSVNLYMTIDPVAGTVQPKYSLDGAPYVDLGTPVTLTGSLLNVVQSSQVMAVGIIGHSGAGSASTTGATWDYVFIQQEQPGVLGVTPAPLLFGDVVQGTFIDQIVSIQNLGQLGDQDINVTGMSITGSADFIIASDPSPVLLNPGDLSSVTIRYFPSDVGSDTATLVINHDGINSPTNLALNGNGIIEYDPIFRVNVGGPQLADPDTILDWSADDTSNPSIYANHGTSGSTITTTGVPIDYSSTTLPSYTPANLFNTGRWDSDNGAANEMTYDFPVPDGNYEVRVYFAEIYAGTAAAGARVWDVELEGVVPAAFDDIDKFALAGFEAGYMLAAETSVSDGSLTVRFLHQVENPELQGIEIIPVFVPPESVLNISSATVDFGTVSVGVGSDQILTLTNSGVASDPAITINGLSYSGADAADFSDNFSGPVTLLPGESLDVTLTATASSGGTKDATLTIDHNGGNAPTDATLTATAYENGALELSPDPLDFGQVELGSANTLSLTLTNLGGPADADIEVTNLVVTGSETYQFQFEPYANPLIVPANSSVTVDVTFIPAEIGVFPVTISASHDGNNSPVSIAASGEGVAASLDPLYRVNVGGPAVTDPAGIMNWESDNFASPSVHYVTGGPNFGGTGDPVDISSGSIPADTPMELFQTERWDNNDGLPNALAYDFPVANGTYEVRIYVAELYTGITAAGQRVFDAEVEGTVPAALDNIDPFALAGFEAGYMVSAEVAVLDGSLSLRFLHQTENPAIKAIEIVESSTTPPALLQATPASQDFGAIQVGDNNVIPITLTHVGGAGSPSLTVNAVSIGNPAFTDNFPGPTILDDGDSIVVNVTFAPLAGGNFAADMIVTHDGANSPTIVSLTGFGAQAGVLEADASSIDFGSVVVAQTDNEALTLTNLGTDPLQTPGSAFVENAGIVVVEVESIPTAGDWEDSANIVDAVGGASGTYYEYTGPNQTSAVDPTDHLIYPIEFTTPGLYRFQMRSQAEPGQPQSEHNDTWVRIDGAGANAVAYLGGDDGGAPDTLMGNGFFKVWMQSTDNFIWTSYHVDGAGQDIYFDITQAGIYEVTLSGRSSLHKIDRFAIYLESSYNEGQLTAFPATPLSPGPGAGSPITVTGLNFSGADPAVFGHNMTLPLVVQPGTSEIIDLTFSPTVTGVRNALLTVVSDSTGGNINVNLTGNGVDAPLAPSFRVNVGGPALTDPAGLLDWEADTGASPSAYYVAGGTNFNGTPNTIDMSSPTLPADTPVALFQTERWDANGGDPLSYEFPVINGTYEVHIYVAEIYGGIGSAGSRVFDAEVEGTVPASFNNIDPYGLAGFESGYMVSAQVDVTDGGLSLSFLHQTENPAIKGIEIYELSSSPTAILGVTPANHDFGAVQVSSNAMQAFTLSNDGVGGAPALNITNISFGDAAFSSDFVGPVVLNEGESTIVNVTFAPTVPGAYATDMTVTHDGSNNPTDVPLTGTGSQASVPGQDVTDLDFGNVLVSTTGNGTVTVTNLGTGGDPVINITALNFSGTDAAEFGHTESLPLAIAPGASEVIDLTVSPLTPGAKSALLTIVHDGIGGDLAVNLTANATTTAPTVSAILRIETGGDIQTSSTYNPSFYIENTSTGGEEIVSVSFDISSALLTDTVFDPVGTAGDSGSRCLFPDGTSAANTGFVTPADLCVDPFSVPYELGFNVITTDFTDFQSGESFLFGVDIDPISTRGTAPPGPDHAASVSGYELLGSLVTVEFSDGSTLTTELWRYNTSVTGSVNTARLNTLVAPSIEVLGIPSTPTFVSNLNQTVRVSGPAGADISLLVSEGEMVEQPGGGYDVDPFELNTILNVAEYSATIGAGGTVDIPITLIDDELLGGTYGGKNYIIAVIRDADQTSPLSNRIVLEYDPAAQPVILFDSNLNFNAQEGQSLVISDSVNASASDASTPTITLTAIDDATSVAPTWLTIPANVVAGNAVNMDIDPLGLAPGVYTATVTGTSAGYTNGVFTITLTVNDLDVVITAPADLAIIAGDTVSVSWTSSGGLIDDHIHVTLDDLSTPAVDPHVGSLPLNSNFDFTGVAPGNYAVIVEMANVNHIVYQGVVTSVTITVQAATPSLEFASDVTANAQEGQSAIINDSVNSSASDGSTPTIALSAIDNGTGVAPTWLTIPANVVAGNPVSADIDPSGLAPGVYTATVTGTSAGYTDDSFTVTLTVNDLEVAITAPANLAVIVGDTVSVSWTSSGGLIDDHIHVTLDDLSTPAVEPFVDGLPLNGNYDFTSVAPGDYAVIVEMTNVGHTVYQGISDTVTISVQAGTTPSLTFANDVNVTAQEGQTDAIYDLIGTGTSDASTPQITNVAIDDATLVAPTWLLVESPVTAGNDTLIIIDASALAPGVYTATVTGSSAGYTDATFTVTLTVNDLEVAITAPGDGATIVGDSVTVTWSTSGDIAGDHLHVTLDDLGTGAVEPHVEAVIASGSYTFTGVAPGSYAVIVQMTNIAHTPYQGISDTVNITVNPIPGITFANDVNVNAQAGQALIINDTVGTGTSDASTPTINLEAIDDFTEIPPTWLTIPANVVAGNPINLSIDVDGLLPGNYSATVTGSANNYADDEFTVAVNISDVDVTIINPGEFERILADTVSVQWSSTAALGNDQVFVTLDNLATGAVEPAVTGLATNGNYDFTGVATGDYEVIVQVADVNGNPYIGATDTHEITVENTGPIPGIVTNILAPAHTGTTSNAYQVFQWQPTTNTTWYYIWMSTPNGPWAEWVNAGQNCTAAVCSHSFESPLGDGAYQWAVLTMNVNGHGGWSAVYDFTVSGGTVAPVTILAPGDSASVNPTFSWTESPGAVWYYLWVNGPQGLVIEQWYTADAVCQLGVCSVAPVTNLSPGTYSVWVQHWGPVYLHSPWTAEYNFTMTGTPGTPVLGAPSGVISNTSPTFNWQAVPGASWYYLWVSDTSGTLILEQWYQASAACAGANCSAAPALNLPDSHYSWWIQSWGEGYGYGPWSARGDFEVDVLSTNIVVPVGATVIPAARDSNPEPTLEPTVEATVTEEPVVVETVTAEPTVQATETVVVEPTVEPTETVVVEPTETVVVEPTAEPTAESTD